MSRARALLLALALAAPAACAPRAINVGVNTRVSVIITPEPDVLPFDPRAARISAATAQLAEVAGHHVALDVDAAMVPEFRAKFEEALGGAFENMTRDLTALRRERPEAFAHSVPQLERVSLRYDALLTRDTAAFDPATRTLTIRGPARGDALVRQGSLYRELDALYVRFAEARYATANPDAVPAAERRAYFDYLRGASDRAPETVADLASSPRASRVLHALRLAELAAGDATLSRDLRDWLFGEASWFVSAYVHKAELVRAIPADCAFRRAEAAYARWMLAAYPGADEAKRLAVARALFVRSFTSDRAKQGGRSYPPFAWPTVDRFAFGLGVVDQWRAAGHPGSLSTSRVPETTEFIVCPSVRRGRATVAPRCEYDWYRDAIETADGRRRLAAALLERGDPTLSETAFIGVRQVSGDPLKSTLSLLRAVEPSAAVFDTGMRVLADSADNARDRPLLEEARRLWIERPSSRGLVLYLLARIDLYDNGNVDWRGFERAFGSRVDAETVSAYLGEGPMAMRLLPIVWPALAKGFSRSALIVPKLDAFLAAPNIDYEPSRSRYGVLSRIVGHLCEEKNVKDLTAVREYLERRVASHPGEPYAPILDDASAARCKPAPPGPPPRPEVRLVPAKQRIEIIQKGWDEPW